MNGTRRRSSTIPSLVERFGVSITSPSSSVLASATSARLPLTGLCAREGYRIKAHRDRCPLLGGVEVHVAGDLGYQRDAEPEPARAQLRRHAGPVVDNQDDQRPSFRSGAHSDGSWLLVSE